MQENPRGTDPQREQPFLQDYQAVAVSGDNGGAESLLGPTRTSKRQWWGQAGVTEVLQNVKYSDHLLDLKFISGFLLLFC